jgi:GT2 family glycosyltransferase
MLSWLGVEVGSRAPRTAALHDELRLIPQSRRPLRLSPSTARSVANAAIPTAGPPIAGRPRATVIVLSHDNYLLTRMCVESVLANTDAPAYELVVVDNGSHDTSRSYLRTIERRFGHIRILLNDTNRGFAAGCNQGLEAAHGDLLVLLNSDTIVAPGWLSRLERAAGDVSVGLVGAVTNRIGNEAEVAVDYSTYGGFLAAAAARAAEMSEQVFAIAMPAMFCLAFRRDVHRLIGPLDEQFGLGTLEDDDYADRARALGLGLICCEDVLIHHFGEGSLGRLIHEGSYADLLEANRRYFQSKWGRAWQPYGRRLAADYELMRQRVREIVETQLPANANVIVASRGDDELVAFEARTGWHFPQASSGVYAGHYPNDSRDAVAHLEQLRARGGDYLLLPRTSLWWLDHYRGLNRYLSDHYSEVVTDEACRIFLLSESRS